ncbi:MAG: efflux RND transporter periplasmic adaptor subunit [Pseudomonadota bacterium]
MAKIVIVLLALNAPAVAEQRPLTEQRFVRGVVTAPVQATITSELSALVTTLPFRVGERFKRGQTLIAFDCRTQGAELKAAEADVDIADVTVRESRQLRRHRAAGANELTIAVAKRDKAKSVAETLRIRLEQCTVKAPFDGRISERHVDLYERPAPNEPLVDIVSGADLEVELIVPSDWVRWLAPGALFKFRIDETARDYDAKLVQLGAVVDPVSRTMRVFAELLQGDKFVRPGMSGSAALGAPGG